MQPSTGGPRAAAPDVFPGDYSETDRKTEMALLGSIIRYRGENLPDALGTGILPGDFRLDAHAEMFAAITQLYADDVKVDSITLTGRLKARGTCETCGGIPYVAECEDSAVRLSAAAEYAAEVVRRSNVRRIRDVALEAAVRARERPTDDQGLIRGLEAGLEAVRGRASADTLHLIREATGGVFEEIEAARATPGSIHGVPSGFERLDQMTGGFKATDMIILGGRPGMGKTAFALNLALAAALPARRQVHRELPPVSVLIVSLEMSETSLAARMLCQLSGLNLLKVRNGDLDAWEESVLARAREELDAAPIYIDDLGGKSASALDVRARCRAVRKRAEREGNPPLGLVIVDYLQLMSPDSQAPGRNREREVASISAALKGLAKGLSLPVICCSQLKRADTGSPELTDLRDSGAIEQDADLVLFVYREECLKPDREDARGKAEIRIAKHRNGPAGNVQLRYVRESACFVPPPSAGFAPHEGGDA
ncbi:MAG: AAA family ATPase [Deltaproteobacteria bacterium]|jgi:replicative DNA helicase|nr:AAA family ATPase [Deltaproteobacteria bacterium]